VSLDLDTIRARANAATEGPWANYGDFAHEVYPANVDENQEPPNIAEVVPRVEDAHFIAHARTDVPALLDELDRAHAKLKWYEDAAETLAAELRAAHAALARVEALAEKWRYKGEFGWGHWQEGYGPDHEGEVLDHASAELRVALETPKEKGNQ
jgi:hypothetical protein